MASAVATAGGTQAPLTSYRGPQEDAQAGRVEKGTMVVSAVGEGYVSQLVAQRRNGRQVGEEAAVRIQVLRSE